MKYLFIIHVLVNNISCANKEEKIHLLKKFINTCIYELLLFVFLNSDLNIIQESRINSDNYNIVTIILFH